MLSDWRHSGFRPSAVSVYFPRMRPPWKPCPGTSSGLLFSHERVQYLAEPAKVVYQAEHGTKENSSMP